MAIINIIMRIISVAISAYAIIALIPEIKGIMEEW